MLRRRYPRKTVIFRLKIHLLRAEESEGMLIKLDVRSKQSESRAKELVLLQIPFQIIEANKSDLDGRTTSCQLNDGQTFYFFVRSTIIINVVIVREGMAIAAPRRRCPRSPNKNCDNTIYRKGIRRRPVFA